MAGTTTDGDARVRALMKRWGITRRVALEVNHLLTLYPSLQVTSGRRGIAHNRAVGGSPTSHHLYGRAVDLVGAGRDLARARNHARDTGAVEVLDEGDHTHLAWT